MLRQAATQACKLKCISFTCGLSAQFSFRRYCYEEDFCEEDFLVAAPHQCDGGTWKESDVPWSFLMMKTTCPQRHKINMKNRKGTKRMNPIMTKEELEKSLESYRKFLSWMYSWFFNCWRYSGGNWLWYEESDPQYADHRPDACCYRRVIPANTFCFTKGLRTIRRPYPNINLNLEGILILFSN